MFIPRVTAETITVSGTGADASTAITLPSTFTPATGGIYDILLKTQIPEGTNGTYITIAGDPLMERMTGDYGKNRREQVSALRKLYKERGMDLDNVAKQWGIQI